jgi:hypothetical protein
MGELRTPAYPLDRRRTPLRISVLYESLESLERGAANEEMMFPADDPAHCVRSAAYCVRRNHVLSNRVEQVQLAVLRPLYPIRCTLPHACGNQGQTPRATLTFGPRYQII